MKISVAFVLFISTFAICFVNDMVHAGGLLSGVKDLLSGDDHHARRHKDDGGLLGGLKDLLVGDKDRGRRGDDCDDDCDIVIDVDDCDDCIDDIYDDDCDDCIDDIYDDDCFDDCDVY